MNGDELFEAVTSATRVLRVETLDGYDVASDQDFLERWADPDAVKPDPAEKATWLDLIRAAADRGHPWRRLRLIPRPVPDYVRYACEWGYVDNVAAGEDIRVLDDDHRGWVFQAQGDFYFVDGRVLHLSYDDQGRFIEAYEENDSVSAGLTDAVKRAWSHATPFSDWWAVNPDLHRDQHVLA